MKCLAFTAALLSLSFAASAQTAESQPAEPTTRRTPEAVNQAPLEQQKTEAKEELDDRNCLRYTGTHLRRTADKDRKCVGAPGRSYSKQGIDRTGAIDLADALRRLDTSVR